MAGSYIELHVPWNGVTIIREVMFLGCLLAGRLVFAAWPRGFGL